MSEVDRIFEEYAKSPITPFLLSPPHQLTRVPPIYRRRDFVFNHAPPIQLKDGACERWAILVTDSADTIHIQT